MNYIEKYKPLKSTNFIGHYKFTNDFKNHIKTGDLNKIILCIGSTGIGKTNLIDLILYELDFNIIKINNIDNYKEEINNYLNTKSIDTFFTKKKKILLIDDLGIYLNNDKNISNYLLNLKIKQPIICILNKQYDRKAIDLKKKTNIFYLNKPPFNITLQYIISILNQENVEIDSLRLQNIKNLIKHNKNNIKAILLNLQNIVLNNNELKEYCLYENKYNDIGLFDAVGSIYNEKHTIPDLDNIIYNDSSLIYMLLHENIINEIDRRTINDDDLLNLFSNFLDDSCEGDIIQEFIYKNNNWNMLNIIYIVKILRLNNSINNYKKNNNEIKYTFTRILTKYSLKCNFNKKKINLLEKNKINQENLDTLLQTILYLLNSLKQYNDDIVLKILEDYNIDKYNIDVLLKYNKVIEILDIKYLNKIKKKLN
tara:strand:- start:926 stop:2200 length:1275 start_codon:yes stop_codon:yes gene_type:complete